MKNNTKSKYFASFCGAWEEKHPDIPEHIRRKIAHSLAEKALVIHFEGVEGMADIMSQMGLEMESHKKKFRDHVETLQKNTKNLYTRFKSEGFITSVIDRSTGRVVLKGKTTMVTDMVQFLNELEKFVYEFYTEVYKITPDSNNDRVQITLF